MHTEEAGLQLTAHNFRKQHMKETRLGLLNFVQESFLSSRQNYINVVKADAECEQ